MYENSVGIVTTGAGTDYLYRMAIRALIQNEKGEVLIVKEKGRDWWDLPGGGLDYGESIKDGLARELEEEIGLQADFGYKIIALQNPNWNVRLGAMQVNAIFRVIPQSTDFNLGVDVVEMIFSPIDEIYRNNPKDSYIVAQLSAVFP